MDEQASGLVMVEQCTCSEKTRYSSMFNEEIQHSSLRPTKNLGHPTKSNVQLASLQGLLAAAFPKYHHACSATM
jgi:hypothetical protein